MNMSQHTYRQVHTHTQTHPYTHIHLHTISHTKTYAHTLINNIGTHVQKHKTHNIAFLQTEREFHNEPDGT